MSTAGPYIYHGIWTNWSRGRVYGATITLSARDGGLLIAFLALCVTVTATSLWRIFSYVVHQARARRAPQDGPRQQTQATFRNASSATSAAWSFFLIAFHWRSLARRPSLRSLLWALFALAYALAAGLAIIFSSEVTKAVGTEALIMSPRCGMWATEDMASFTIKSLTDSVAAADHARTCYYGDLDQSRLQCNTYTVPRIDFNTNSNASCPFGPDMCMISSTAAFKMDSGRMSSHSIFGINGPTSARVDYRKVSTCAPLVRRAEVRNNTGKANDIGKPGDQILELFYGPTVGLDDNITMEYNTHTALSNFGYRLWALHSLVGERTSTWDPTPELKRTDADVVLIMVAPNSIRFTTQCDDPFFPAHQNLTVNTPLTGIITPYLSDYYMSVMGCTEQYQFCNPLNGRCTDLTGSELLLRNADALELNPVQGLTKARLSYAAQQSALQVLLSARGASALRAQETVSQLNQAPLPPNQWTIEASTWFSVGLASLQKKTVEYATGPAAVPGLKLQIIPDTINREMCSSQKVHATDGSISFSALGTFIILVLSTTIVLTSLCVDSVVGWIQHRVLRRGVHRRLQWILDETLQLQRLAFEEVGMGTWSGTTASVPVTRAGELLGGFDATIDPDHPRLSRAMAAAGGGSGGSSTSVSDVKSGMTWTQQETGPLMGGYAPAHTTSTFMTGVRPYNGYPYPL